LDTYADIKVVADAEGGEETVRTALAKKPDVIVMDLMMPGMDGMESTRRILAEWPDAKILILTTYGTADAIGHTLEAGAKGAMMKNAELDELVAAIKKVARGERFIDAEISQMLSENPPIPELSPRQRQILESVTRGLSNEEIAKMLGIGLSVEKEHVRATFAKIGAANRSEAVAIALRKHLLKI
jgi:DNA-binding NarL/FixJ family response regulator